MRKKRIVSGGKFDRPDDASRYVDISGEEFKELFIWAVSGLPVFDIHIEEEQAITGVNRSEEIISVYFRPKSVPNRRCIFRGYTGFDPVRQSRYGDAMRIIGFYEVGEGKYVPIGSAVTQKTRTYHTKGWKENLQKRLEKTLHDLEERVKKVKTMHDHIVTEIGTLPWQDVLNITDNPDGTVNVSFTKYIGDPKQFNKMISVLKAIGLRYNPQTKKWYG